MAQDILTATSSSGNNMRTALLLVFVLLLVSMGLLYWALGDVRIMAAFAASLIALTGIGWFFLNGASNREALQIQAPDWSIIHEASAHDSIASAITDEAGIMVCANLRFMDLFGSEQAPPGLPLTPDDNARLTEAGRAAWRDGYGLAQGLEHRNLRLDAEVSRVGSAQNYLLWRFSPVVEADLLNAANQMLVSTAGRILSRSGIMTAIIGPEGRIRSCNSAFAMRASGQEDGNMAGRDFAALLCADDQDRVVFRREGHQGRTLRLTHIPLIDPGLESEATREQDMAALIMLMDDDVSLAGQGQAHDYVRNLLEQMPLGLAMTDRDGRILHANPAFARASGVELKDMPPYPGDLVIREDKSALADAVHRQASGQAASADLTIRLARQPDEPVQMSIAGLRGMGEAAVLLTLKDNSEEARLKRQIAQASKMQAIGQLAGGVAHDFNNVLTAIIGHCDLMLLRHSPGDSDYDDIQQIKNNSNRAAALTRQLLAFSRQQTLRPQVLQLPDIVSDVSALLKRLLGEKITLEVNHDRNLGAVRADPVQLEQVIINLAVNARDAMLENDKGGTLGIRTKRVSSADVRAMADEILPPGNYSALLVEDDGIGMPPEITGKIFEPFFTTKDVGKGTGLGLSTVYGIIKQSGGYIFVDSEPGKGSVFSIYFPVHRSEARDNPAPERIADKSEERQWGDERILLVEDEAMVRAVAERALSRQGYSVVCAMDGEEGLALFTSDGPFDLVVSDVVMPNMDGPAMAAGLRELQPDLPILFMSGYAEEQLRQSISLDDVHFLPKPFSVSQIVETVRSTLSQRQ